jgi:hypothetical protein
MHLHVSHHTEILTVGTTHLAIAGLLFSYHQATSDTYSEHSDLPTFRTSAPFNTRRNTDDDKVMGKEKGNDVVMPSTSRPNFHSLVPPRGILEADRLRRVKK